MIFAIIVGGIINIFLAKYDNKHVCSEHGECIECGDDKEGFSHRFILHPLFHAIKVFIYLLIVNIIFGIIIYYCEDSFYGFIEQNLYLQPIVSSLIGLIPNCASSIIISEAFMQGAISLGGLIAGLSANAGMGIIILFRNKKNWKSALVILATTFFAGIIIGYLTILIF